jgi:hypothetical protein
MNDGLDFTHHCFINDVIMMIIRSIIRFDSIRSFILFLLYLFSKNTESNKFVIMNRNRRLMNDDDDDIPLFQ